MFSSLSSSALNRRDAVKYAAFSITSAFLLSSCGVGTQNPAASSSTSQAVVDEQSTRTVLENLADQLRSSIAPNQKALRGPNSAADTPEIQPMVDTPTPAFPVTFKDFNGAEVTVKSADRVLALDLYGTLAQQMIALGLGGRLVGRVTSSTEQSLAHLPLVTQNGHDLNAEAILATSPDLVLWDKSNGPIEIVDQLRAAGVTVVVFDHERRMDKIIPQLKAVAQALGVPEAGEQVAARVQKDLDYALQVLKDVAPKGEQQVSFAFLYVRGTAGVFFVLGKGSGADDLIQAIGTLRTKQRVMAKDLQNRDVFGYYVDKGWMCVQVFFVRQGKLIERDVNLFPYYNDPDEDFLTYVGQFYQEKSHLVPNEILIPQDIDEEAVKALVDTKVLKPQRGEKKQLVNLAIKNARVSLEQKFNLLEKSVEKTQGAIENLGRLLQIPTPVRIESFDNSNIMGTSPVSAMVVFVNGKPSKKDYRKYKIKTVVGPDDYASMREVIRRRYGRVQRDGLTPPDLIVIDGGQGQVNIAKQVIQEELGLDIPIAGLQKNDKHQTHELLFGDPLEVVELSRNSQEFFLLQRIQDEVHRFAITFHRQLRSKNSFSSQLDGIEGLGPKRKQNLMKYFKSLTKIKEASVDEIVEVGVPRVVAEAVQRKLNPQEEEELAQVAEERVDYQTEGEHYEP